MIEIPPWYKIALGEIGVKEAPGPNQANPRILEYLRAVAIHTTSDEIPWCAAFVNWCLQQAHITGTHSAAARSFMNWGEVLKAPKVGCIAILKRGTGWQGHVAFYEGQKAGGRVILYGGNQKDEVRSSNYPVDDVLGYRFPGKKK